MSEVLPDRIAHALRYPFNPPHRAYRFRDGGLHPPEPFDPAGLHAVVASGSNGSPDRLQQKFGNAAGVPVTYGIIHDLVPVFAARVTGYGSVPATLAVVPGARAGVHVTWLTDAQLQIMHQTESVGTGYAYCALEGFTFTAQGDHPQAPLHAYISLHGALAPEGRLLPMDQVPQTQAQQHVMDSFGFAGTLAEFVRLNLDDPDHRLRANDAASRIGQAIDHARLIRIA
ncbi:MULTISPECIES: hypothetical protein [unclassified Minwuia]|jgi:hypothetical protein|uniref:hypothetical protein n=1 Tax=unclassified Minwuia TaxID=2618799 RepID=UPI002478AB66|nr:MULTISPECIES: hypothetical protein [unclassified Minwuia]